MTPILHPYVVERFTGLDLVHDPLELGPNAASDLLNVDVDLIGALRTRDGFTQFNTNTLGAFTYDSLFGSPGGFLFAVRAAGAVVSVDKISNAGVISNIGVYGTVGTDYITSVAHIGLPTGALRSYMAHFNNGVQQQLNYTDGAAVVPVNLGGIFPKPQFVAVSPRSNRLVMGFFDAAAGSPSGAGGTTSRIYFSNANDPDTWVSTNFVDLHPGDGEVITGIVTWRDQMIVFKQTKMFVFYGETPDDDGLPIFNYHMYSLPSSLGMSTSTVQRRKSQRIVAGNDAVYFSATDGIYATNGSTIHMISEAIKPIWSVEGDVYAPTYALFRNTSAEVLPTVWYAHGKLYVIYTADDNGINDDWLVWDEGTKAWRHWLLPTTFLPVHIASLPAETWTSTTTQFSMGPSVFFVSGAADGKVYVMNRSWPSDNGAAISWFYTSGYSDLGNPGEKRVRFADVYGGTNGNTVRSTFLTNSGRLGGHADTGVDLTLGISPTIARARRSGGVRGRMIAHKLSGSGQSRISRVEYRYALGRES